MAAINFHERYKKMRYLFISWIYLTALMGARSGDAETDLYKGLSDYLVKHPFPGSPTSSEIRTGHSHRGQ